MIIQRGVFMAGIFKAYDVRGKVPSELDGEKAYQIGRAFVDFLDVKEVVVGRDMRLSSDKLFKELAKGIVEQGADVIDVGVCGSSMLYFAAAKRSSAIMITASHNPKEYNGFKFCRENAVPLSSDTGIGDIEGIVASGKFTSSRKKGTITREDILDDYIKYVLKFAKDIKDLKIVVDAGNGMGGLTVPKIAENLGIKVIPLYFKRDGSFPNHEANPLKPENLIDLQERVKKEKADFGIAFDGDGDRCVFVDDKGEAVSGDLMTAIIGKELLKKNPGSTIVYDLRSSWVVKEEVEKQGGTAIETRVGHAFIKQFMREKKAIFAGELSGHYYFKEANFVDNADVAFIEVMNFLSAENNSFSSILKPLRRYYSSGERNLEVEDKDKILREIRERYQKRAKRFYELDGLSGEFDSWHFNVRASNTEPLLRFNIEAKTKKEMEKRRDELLRIGKKH